MTRTEQTSSLSPSCNHMKRVPSETKCRQLSLVTVVTRCMFMGDLAQIEDEVKV